MTTLNENGYFERITRTNKNPSAKSTRRDWWLVKYNGNCVNFGYITLDKLKLPKE